MSKEVLSLRAARLGEGAFCSVLQHPDIPLSFLSGGVPGPAFRFALEATWSPSH